MNPYLIGTDILGENANANTGDLCAERPMSADSARRIAALCVRRLQGCGLGDSDTAAQLVDIDEAVVLSGLRVLPDKSTNVLVGLAARAVGECDILGGGGGGGGGGHGGGHGGHGGGHGGGGHHGGGGGGGGWGWGGARPAGFYSGWYPWETDYVEVEDVIDTRCVEFDADGNCLKYVPVDLLGGGYDVLGMFDIAQAQRQMVELRKVPVAIAQVLLRRGQQAIETAIVLVDGHNLHMDGGDKKRDEIRWKLRWHADTLSKLSKPNEIYASGEDLKNWVMQAFIAQNAAEEGAGANVLGKAWADYKQMWVEIAQAAAKLPAEIRKAVFNVASGAVEAVTGLPIWAWALIALGTVAGLGFIFWKLANSKAGAAAAGMAVRRLT